MQNHNCAFAKYCNHYELDSCQGCARCGDTSPGKVASEFVKDNVLSDISTGSDVYLATKSGRIPVRIEDITISSVDENARFSGHTLTVAERYCGNDVKVTNMVSWELVELQRRAYRLASNAARSKLPGIKSVHFSGPVTVVIWADGTKTLVRKGENDEIDYEKGLAMAIAKKALGTNETGSNYYDIFKKWLPKPEEEEETEETMETEEKEQIPEETVKDEDVEVEEV